MTCRKNALGAATFLFSLMHKIVAEQSNFANQHQQSREEVREAGDHGCKTLTGQKVSAPSRGKKVEMQHQWSAGALGSCWTEEDIISPVPCSFLSLLESIVVFFSSK